MNILLTGATGFLGRNLLLALSTKKNHRIFAVSHKKSTAISIQSDIHWIAPSQIEGVLIQHHIDCVIHTATSYGRLNESVTDIFAANTCWPLSILELACKHNVDLFIDTGTSLPDQLNAYSLSKSQFRDWGKQLATIHLIRFLHLRLEHFYGPDKDHTKFVSYLIHHCLHNTQSIPLTAGEAKRDFIYIDDVVAAYLCLLDNQAQLSVGYQEFGLGSETTISVRELAEIIKETTRSTSLLNFGKIPYRKDEVMLSIADATALHRLGWYCKTSLREGIRKSLEL